MRAELASKLEKLEKLVSKMDVPVYRRRNVRWLQSHLHERNLQHKNYQQAMEIIEELLCNGVAN